MELEYRKRLQNEKVERHQKCRDYWDRAGIVGLWAAALVGLAAIIVSSHDSASQLTAIGNQVGEMRAEQRPWVSLQNSAIELLYFDSADSELRARLRFAVQNTGKDPAASVQVNAEMSVAREMPYDSMQRWQEAVCHEVVGPGLAVFPGSLEPAFVQDVSAKMPRLTQGGDSAHNMYVMPVIAACIVYKDAATQVIHYTPFALQLERKPPKAGGPCCAVFLGALPIEGDQLSLFLWSAGNLPPT